MLGGLFDEDKKENLEPLPGFRLAKPMVFQGLFPTSADQFEGLRAAVERLTLNDASAGRGEGGRVRVQSHARV